MTRILWLFSLVLLAELTTGASYGQVLNDSACKGSVLSPDRFGIKKNTALTEIALIFACSWTFQRGGRHYGCRDHVRNIIGGHERMRLSSVNFCKDRKLKSKASIKFYNSAIFFYFTKPYLYAYHLVEWINYFYKDHTIQHYILTRIWQETFIA
jgi:hypothetical protein